MSSMISHFELEDQRLNHSHGKPSCSSQQGGAMQLLWVALSSLLGMSAVHSAGASSARLGGYVETFARKMLIYCSIGMLEPEEVESWNFPNPACNSLTVEDKLVRAFRSRDTAFGYIVINHAESYILASFKASNDTRDWIQHDLHSLPFAYRDPCVIRGVALPGHVHHGFCSYYTELADLGMGDMLRDLHLEHKYPVYVTGHSLGAAAAVVCAADLKARLGIEPAALYTFGQPRVGDREFSDALGNTGRAFRVVHRRDVVPHLTVCCGAPGPCRDDPMCPYHQGPEVWYDNGMVGPGGFKMCRDGESQRCSDGQALDVRTWDHDHYFGVRVSNQCKGPDAPTSLSIGTESGGLTGWQIALSTAEE